MLETNFIFRDMIRNNPNIHKISESDVKRLQKTLLEMMDDIDMVCRKYHLTYFLCGGSALGAVRHGGFIPWDDDMDLVMPRRDYDLLEKYMYKEFPDRYWVQDVRTDSRYDISSMKIRKKGTRCVEVLDSEPEKAGIFIDIYPLEDTYDNSFLRVAHGYLGEAFLFVCSCVRLRGKKERILKSLEDPKSLRVVKKKLAIGSCFSFLSLIRWLRVTEKILSCCHRPDSKYVSIPSGRKHYFGELYTRQSFFPPRKIGYDGHSYYIMNDPSEYLEKLYGDYMTIPPEKDREYHGVLELEFERE